MANIEDHTTQTQTIVIMHGSVHACMPQSRLLVSSAIIQLGFPHASNCIQLFTPRRSPSTLELALMLASLCCSFQDHSQVASSQRFTRTCMLAFAPRSHDDQFGKLTDDDDDGGLVGRAGIFSWRKLKSLSRVFCKRDNQLASRSCACGAQIDRVHHHHQRSSCSLSAPAVGKKGIEVTDHSQQY